MDTPDVTTVKEVPGPSGTVRVEDLQSTVEALVRRALEANSGEGTRPPNPHGDSGKRQVCRLLPRPWEVTWASHAGEPF